jgi:hypothetical protein
MLDLVTLTLPGAELQGSLQCRIEFSLSLQYHIKNSRHKAAPWSKDTFMT